ncbi:hypothetical protein RSAG8_03969, partial [Rhizoctonia solani AG-8 WAC10335]
MSRDWRIHKSSLGDPTQIN